MKSTFLRARASLSLVAAIAATTVPASVRAFSIAPSIAARANGSDTKSSSSALGMVRTRGLERREEGATPLPGGMTLYLKAAEDGASVGDCPFAHYVRMVLNEKGLEYELAPSTDDTKPRWLVDEYGGQLPALRHRKECYVESDVVAQYLDYFFRETVMGEEKGRGDDAAADAVDGFFPAFAKYAKHRPNGDGLDNSLREKFEERLSALEGHLNSGEDRAGPYFSGTGERFTLLDCSLAPKLHHMDVCLEHLKDAPIDLGGNYPALRNYMDKVFQRPSFKETCDYSTETILWGWKS